jgi:hypothetical protein
MEEEKDKKKKKGFLSKVWNTVSSPWISIPLAVAMTVIVGPLFFDMGTWLGPFHDPTNMRTLAWANKVNPFTSWLPYHLGFTEPGGFLYDFMTWFLGSDLETLIAQQDAAGIADKVRETVTTDLPESDPFSFSDEECEFFGNCEGPSPASP